MRSSRRNQGLEAEAIPDISDSNSDSGNIANDVENEAQGVDTEEVVDTVQLGSVHSDDVNL